MIGRRAAASIPAAASIAALSGAIGARATGRRNRTAGAGGRFPADSTSGSSNGKFTCTGPGRGPSAACTARRAQSPNSRSDVPSARTGRSVAQRTSERNMPTWSIVWSAPRSRSRGGRSVVQITRGMRERLASATAGAKFDAAVPEVHTTATGRPVALANPRAKKDEERSSRCNHDFIDGCSANARVSGVDRDPGVIQQSVMPAPMSPATNSRAALVLARPITLPAP